MGWGSVVGSLIGGVSSALGQRSANKMNWKIAKRQMDFQERMSNTAYQRAAKDLEAAGLNRILALGNPASSPGGASAQMGNVGAAGVEGATSGAAIAVAKKQASKLAAETWNVKADTELKNNQAFMVQQQAFNESLRSAGIISANDIAKAEAQIRRLSIPRVQSLADFYNWMVKQDSSDLFKKLDTSMDGAVGALVRVFLLMKGGQ